MYSDWISQKGFDGIPDFFRNHLYSPANKEARDAALDNLYLHNNPRVEVSEANAGPNTLDDLLVSRPGGVVRTKTAEGRMQAFVLGAIPFVLLAVLHQMDPTYLVPLFETTTGNVVLIIAVMLWFSAIIMARRILTVDI